MKAALLNKKVFDDIFMELVEERSSWRGGHVIIRTFDIAKKLWSRHRVAYKAEAPLVRKKMREWWNSYKWKEKPRPHKLVCDYAVYLSSPMGYDYCMLETRQSLICSYPSHQQKMFREHGEEK